MHHIKRIVDIDLPRGQSAFLWGPRKTGKSQYLKKRWPASPCYDFLKADVFFELSKNPELLRQQLQARDATLAQPMAVLDARATAAERAGVPWVLAGDLNALPPGESPDSVLERDRDQYPEAASPVTVLYEHHVPAMTPDQYRADPGAWRTYLPPGATTADRTLDYAFLGSRVEKLDHRVLTDVTDVSDHLPLLLEIRVP